MKCYLGHPLTNWYPPHIKPVRVGLYIVGSDDLSAMMTWNGRWFVSADGRTKLRGLCWRGIAGEPKS